MRVAVRVQSRQQAIQRVAENRYSNSVCRRLRFHLATWETFTRLQRVAFAELMQIAILIKFL